MPVSKIVTAPPVPPTAAQGRDRDTGQPAQARVADLPPAVAASTTSTELTPAQQAALLINETLLNLSFAPLAPTDALLLHETNPILVETIEAASGQTPSQQTAELVNTTLRDLSATPPALTMTEVTARATATVAATQVPNFSLPGITPTPEALAQTEGPPSILPATPGTVTAPSAPTVTGEARGATQQQDLLATTATQPRDPTPFAFAVYEVRDQNPAPGDPKPMRREVIPPLPPGRVRPVDRLVLKREWERRRENNSPETNREETPMAERSIRQVINQANEDLIANGLPLRLVLARSEAGYSLDIYNCSADMCRLEQEVPLDLKELATLLDNIQHETGIIINIRT